MNRQWQRYCLLFFISQKYLQSIQHSSGAGRSQLATVAFPRHSTPPTALHSLPKGAGVFERPGQTMDNMCVFGTSRTSNGLKSGPQSTCHLILMKIYFLSHKISHLWLKIAIIWPIFSHFWPIFAGFLLYRLYFCVL